MTRLRKAVLEWVECTIASEWPGGGDTARRELAESLVAIGEKYQVPDEVLIQWIHMHEPHPAAWKRECEDYAETRRRILEAAENTPEQRTLLDLPRPPSGFGPR